MKKYFVSLFILVLLVSGCDEFRKGFSEGRTNANEGMAQMLCKVYAQKIEVYKKDNQRYPASFQELYEAGYFSSSDTSIPLILQSKPAQGYYYNYSYIDRNHFILEVKPVEKDVTGSKTFKVNETSVINIY